jgi:hypothetical protein
MLIQPPLCHGPNKEPGCKLATTRGEGGCQFLSFGISSENTNGNSQIMLLVVTQHGWNEAKQARVGAGSAIEMSHCTRGMTQGGHRAQAGKKPYF